MKIACKTEWKSKLHWLYLAIVRSGFFFFVVLINLLAHLEELTLINRALNEPKWGCAMYCILCEWETTRVFKQASHSLY